MADFQLYCFAQSGNAYRAALMLNLIGADWEPIWIDFLAGGATRKPDYREEVNEMGEVPVLVHGRKKLTQSGVILTYLSALRPSSNRRARMSGWKRCAGSFLTIRKSMVSSGRTASCAILPSRRAIRR